MLELRAAVVLWWVTPQGRVEQQTVPGELQSHQLLHSEKLKPRPIYGTRYKTYGKITTASISSHKYTRVDSLGPRIREKRLVCIYSVNKCPRCSAIIVMDRYFK